MKKIDYLIIKRITIICVMAAFAIFFFINFRGCYLYRKEKITSEISFIVMDTAFFDNNRGMPSYKVNGKWRPPYSDETYLHNFVTVGDSLFKSKGSLYFEVYRKNNKGEYVKIFGNK